MRLTARIARYGVVGTTVAVLYSLAIVFFIDAPPVASALAIVLTVKRLALGRTDHRLAISLNSIFSMHPTETLQAM